jgi:hypothetical protein
MGIMRTLNKLGARYALESTIKDYEHQIIMIDGKPYLEDHKLAALNKILQKYTKSRRKGTPTYRNQKINPIVTLQPISQES